MRKFYNKILTTFLLAFISSNICFAQITYTVIASKTWSAANVFSPNGTPTSIDNVIVPAGFTLTVNGTDICNNITISGGTLQMTAPKNLEVYGNFINNGTLSLSSGTVTFMGASNQSISGSSCTFFNLTSSPNTGVTVSMAVPVTINNNFTISQGTFNCSSNQITSTGASVMTMSAATTFILGSSVVATAIAFPTGFSTITIDPTSTVIFEANIAQAISGAPNYGNLTITAGTATTTNTLGGNVDIFGNLLIQDGSGVVTFDQNGYKVGLHGNVTDNGILLSSTNGGARDSLSGTSGVQALTSTEAGGLHFYDLYVNNSSSASPAITATCNINVSDKIKYLSGQLDLQGHTIAITRGTTTIGNDVLSGGSIISSSTGAQFNVTDPDTSINLEFNGVDSVDRFIIGGSGMGITISTIAYNISFEYFTEYGTALFEQVGDSSNAFGGGNGFHGPVTFNAYKATKLWKFGNFSTQPGPLEADTFYTCTVLANANGVNSSNNNFILGANNTETFNGTTTFTSNTAGGFYIGRSNNTGQSYVTFNGPLICSISSSGFMEFAQSTTTDGTQKTAIFNNTIQLNSSASSTGHFYFGTSSFSTITLGNNLGQFIGTGSLLGQSTVFLEDLTQLGSSLTQTINTAGSTGFLEVGGGTTKGSSLPCTFNAPCVFSADTAGYIIKATFASTAPLTFNVNHPSANGYLISNTFNGTVTATIGAMRIQNNTFNSTATLTGTNSVGVDSSTTNGGNTFNAAVTISNTGSAFLFFGMTGIDHFNSDVTFSINGACVMGSGGKYKSTYGGNISITGVAEHMYFGSYLTLATGGIAINGTGTQIMSIAGSALTPIIQNLNMDMTAAGTNIFEISNFNPLLAGTLTFSSGNTGLIFLNGNNMTLGYLAANPTTPCAISYPAAATGATAGWIYGGGTITRDIATGTIALPTGATNATTATAGFFPIGSSPTLNVFQPLWVALVGSGGATTAGSITVSQPSNASWFTPITAYTDASWGASVIGVSNADWSVSAGNGLVIGGTASIEFGGFGFQNFVDADVNASYNNNYAVGSTYVAPANLWGATDLEVKRSALTQAQLVNTWHIGTDNVAASPLPIQLTSFTADCNNYTAAIKWTTATETNNAYFTLERTSDGYNFSKVLEVKGAGTSTTTQDYSAIDQSPYTATSYYRLSQTDLDGKTTIVGTAVYVPCENENEINSFTYANTIKVEINTTQGGSYTIELYNTFGQQIITQTVNANQGLNTFSLSPTVAGGVYMVHVVSPTASYTKKVVLGL